MFLSFCLLSLLPLGIENFDAPSVILPQGKVVGFHKASYFGRIFSSFEGIPYAEPPLDELRFKAPKPAAKWKEILIANKSSSCCQMIDSKISGSEDCLFINVYVPRKKIDSNDNFEVVVHIHGGGFVKNSAFSDALPDYIMDKELIVVTMNYRLGVFGFLSTQDEIITGNFGLKDQNLALKWIKDNIHYFGGNENSITLTGFSSGGASVHYHYSSPLSFGLFHRGYSISGTALNKRAFLYKPLELVEKFAKNLKCSTETSQEILNCLKKKSFEDLVNTTIQFLPSIEKNKNPFLSNYPYRIIKEKKIYDVPWITTNVANETYYLLDTVYKEKSAIDAYENWDSKGSDLLKLNDTVPEDKIVGTLEKLKEKYFGDADLNENEALFKLNEMMSDRFFFFPTDLALRSQAHAMKSKVYYALSKYVPEDHLQCGGPPTAASHCVDVRLLFKFKKNPDKFKPNDEKMMVMLTGFLETYAKTGIPRFGNETWLSIDPSQDFLNIMYIESPENFRTIRENELICRKFWNSLPIKENENCCL